MTLLTRRKLLATAGLCGATLVGARLALPALLRPGPIRPLSPAAAELVANAFVGLDRRRVYDSHVHLIGLGAGGTGCEINPELRSHAHPKKRLQFDCYLAAAGVTDGETADADYVRRLLALHRQGNPEGKLVLLAFDQAVGEDGVPIPALSELHVPDAYVLAVAKANPDVVPCASIHPYRADALDRLEAAFAAGARAVKWLPNSMGIDPASGRCDAFYDRLTKLGIPLISHAGVEKAVDAREAQELGNPLRLRRALERGVRVVVAHCGALGDCEDLDHPGSRLPAFELFLRLTGEPSWASTLLGDLSAMTQVNRCCDPLKELLRRPELHPRLLNGSDYPLPAVDLLVSLRQLVAAGLLAEEDRTAFGELFSVNPLLFDLVLKRQLRLEEGGSTLRFAARVFETAWLFDRPA